MKSQVTYWGRNTEFETKRFHKIRLNQAKLLLIKSLASDFEIY